MLKRISTTALALLLVPTLVGAAESKFVSGDLGSIDLNAKALTSSAASNVLQDILVSKLDGEGDENMVMVKLHTDRVGDSHLRFQQMFNGLKVVGGDMYMHVGPMGKVFAVNGSFTHGSDLPLAPALTGEGALGKALERANLGQHEVLTAPELTYVIADDDAYLAYSAVVDYVNNDGPQRDIVFADAMTGRVVARHPQFHYARSLETYNCNNGTSNAACSNLVSSSSNTINTGDSAIDAAHNFAIATYDYYFNNHGRDSINDNGLTMKSRVHYSSNYNNAFWDGTQMTYGDGDGTTFKPLSEDADVVAHELTHGVTSSESNLVYSNESGALNEALSDIFGAMVDRQEGATGADIWHVGEDIYTPNTPNDGGIRNMADPQDNGDYDYYPTRYTGSQDNGGVHWNSGIANLAFQLLVDGGTHPRGTTSNSVPSIGFAKAADIFYYANTSCLTSNSNFEAARNCTAAGATALYGATELAAVHEAWDAVGVPGGPGGPSCTANGQSCSSNSDCCSNKCRGRRGSKTCR